jgi:UDP-2,4-diacetamido-2,4,6-trideoxy-beta-L-altropyranose hydrolase
MMESRILLVRCDASVAIGTGHAMRCLALAQVWQDTGGCAVFAMAQTTPAVEERLQREKIKVVQRKAEPGSGDDAQQTVVLARENQAAWVVIDGYCFGADYQTALKDAGLKVLFIDDNGHAGHYSADIVLNQNAHAGESLYRSREVSTQLLLGPRFAVLRREFAAWRGWKREIPKTARNVLVTMGGSDPDNLTAKVIEAIRELANPELETAILVGGSNPHLPAVEAAAKKDSMRVTVDAANIPELMAWADVAVAGAGTTFWEICFLGLPAILLTLAENQNAVALAGEGMGTAWSLGNGGDVSACDIAGKLAQLIDSREVRSRQSEQGRRLVDGRGAERVLAFLSDLEFRRTIDSDCEVFWEWANDPEVRAASFNGKVISWEDHTRWFRAKLGDPQALFYTASKDGQPVGEVRYQVNGKRAVLSISLDPRFRGRGWGQRILALGTERAFQDTEVEFIDAYVKPSNQASLKLFAGAGFQRFPSEVIEGQEGVHFVLEKHNRSIEST